ncbi:MAG: DUF6777 domain-containing protein [Microthrixaceae bacterium]
MQGARQGGGCDKEMLKAELDQRPEVKAEYAQVLGMQAEEVNGYIDTLEPQVLGTNMKVTNHGLNDQGKAYPIASDLEAGTAVLVDKDESGKLGGPQPVTRCKCGNPLLKAPELGVKRPEWVTTTTRYDDTTTSYYDDTTTTYYDDTTTTYYDDTTTTYYDDTTTTYYDETTTTYKPGVPVDPGATTGDTTRRPGSTFPAWKTPGPPRSRCHLPPLRAGRWSTTSGSSLGDGIPEFERLHRAQEAAHHHTVGVGDDGGGHPVDSIAGMDVGVVLHRHVDHRHFVRGQRGGQLDPAHPSPGEVR